MEEEEGIRESPPAAGEWRTDALGDSRHSRLEEEIRPPAEDFDEAKALEVCARITRDLLGDFSPALILLSVYERQRVQTLLAYTQTLFDFARQRGVQGEKLAQINRWEFTLETTLSGQPVGQPVFVRMAREQKRRPWSTEALDGIAACARRRATRLRPLTPEEADADAERLARAAASALLGGPPPGEIGAFAGALIRLRRIQLLGSEVDGRRNPLAESDLSEDDETPERLVKAAQRDCGRLRTRLLKAPRGLVDLPAGYRRAAVFCLLAALELLTQIEEGDTPLLKQPPQIKVMTRVGLLLRARWWSRG